jgi:protein-tyrosine-phosphatase
MMAHRQMNVLFLCTANSARSILAEAILAKRGEGRFVAFSAGSFPRGSVNPMAVRVLAESGHDISRFRSKSWDEFAEDGAPIMDFIFTVCDAAAGEACPYWPGHPASAHWGIADPAAADGSDSDVHAAFMEAYHVLDKRICAFIALPFADLDKQALADALAGIGRLAGATELAKA